MAIERTLSLIKPDATGRNLTGAINKMIEEGDLRIVAQKRLKLSETQAEAFYHIHKDKDFFKSLVASMTQGDIVAQVLEGENAINKYRELMGPTDPKKQPKGSIRAAYGLDYRRNSVHGSDWAKTQKRKLVSFLHKLSLLISILENYYGKK